MPIGWMKARTGTRHNPDWKFSEQIVVVKLSARSQFNVSG
jgi:hypothetical protein